MDNGDGEGERTVGGEVVLSKERGEIGEGRDCREYDFLSEY